MAARPRKKARRDWPAGLDETRPGYYVWRNPVDGERIAIGRIPLADAKMQALEANLHVAGRLAKPRLITRLTGAQDTTLGQWLADWLKRLSEKTGDDKPAPNTVKSYTTSVNAISGEIGGLLLTAVDTAAVADALEKIESARGQRTAQACRSVMKTALNAAIAKGKIKTNPVLVTEDVKVIVKRQRFTWESFSKVWDTRETWPVWLRNAVALALVSAQRREDIAAAVFADIDDDLWRVAQIKTKKKLAIPLDLRMDVFGMSLRDVVTACRRTGIVSRHLVHQDRPYGNTKVGAPIFIDTISRRFSEYVAGAIGTGDTEKDEHLPTLHELRSLAKRLYTAQGGVDTKALLGHTTERMSDMYHDARGVEYQRVKLG